MKKLLLFLAVGLLASYGAQAATINVPADQPTIQAAIDAAMSGDVIVPVDGTYNEDLIFLGATGAGVPAGTARNNITIQGSDPANVIIDCPNTLLNSPGLSSGILGLLGQAFGTGGFSSEKGIIIEGNDITLRNLTIRNNSVNGDALFGESSAVCLMGDNCTIDNCIIEANPDNNAGRALYVITGDYDAAFGDPGITGTYPSPGFSALNSTITNTVFRYGDSTIDTVDAAFYLGVVGFAPTISPVRVGSGSFTGCEVTGGPTAGGAIGEIDGGVYSFIDCHFYDYNDGMESGGGSWSFINCLFERSHNQYAARSNWTGEGGVTQTIFNFTDCVFCGHSSSGMLRLQESDALIAGCIFNVTDTDNRPAIRYSPGDYDSDWTLFGGYPASSNVTIDHCDFYNPNGTGIVGDDPQDTPGEPVGNLIVTNSIFQCAEAINLTGATGLADRNATVDNNDLYTTGSVSNPDGGWIILSETANLNEDPAYVAPGICPDPDDSFEYIFNNTNLATASTTGGALGSQGTLPPVGSDVANWELYR